MTVTIRKVREITIEKDGGCGEVEGAAYSKTISIEQQAPTRGYPGLVMTHAQAGQLAKDIPTVLDDIERATP